jgi:uncharacterized protein (DUF433 family)
MQARSFCSSAASVVVSDELPSLSCKMKPFCYHSHVDYSKIITIEPGKRSGKPCIRGMRMTVTDVLEYLASGMSQEEILADFPDLTDEDIKACLAFAADRERKLATLPDHETAL